MLAMADPAAAQIRTEREAWSERKAEDNEGVRQRDCESAFQKSSSSLRCFGKNQFKADESDYFGV